MAANFAWLAAVDLFISSLHAGFLDSALFLVCLEDEEESTSRFFGSAAAGGRATGFTASGFTAAGGSSSIGITSFFLMGAATT